VYNARGIQFQLVTTHTFGQRSSSVLRPATALTVLSRAAAVAVAGTLDDGRHIYDTTEADLVTVRAASARAPDPPSEPNRIDSHGL